LMSVIWQASVKVGSKPVGAALTTCAL